MSFRSYVFSALAFTVVLAGCSGSSHMTPQNGGVMLGTPQSVSPALIPPAPMAHTAILPASVMNVKPQRTIQGLNWTQISGAASYAAAAPDGSLWVLSTSPTGSDKYIWHYVNGTWTNISGLATRLSVAPDGTLYAINSGGGTYSYSGGSWTALGGGASDITVASDGSVYVLSNGGSGPDYGIWHNVSGTWSQMPGAGVRIAASWDPNSFVVPGGTVSANGLYVLNSAGSIYYKNPDNSYVQLSGSASAVASTTIGGVFVLGYPANNNGNSIYYYNLNTPGWTEQSGAAVSISTDSAHLYAIGSTGSIYSSPLAPGSGTIIEYTLPTSNGSPLGIAAGPDGNLWFTEFNASKIGKITTSGTFTEYAIPTSNAEPYGIAVGPDGNLWFTEYNSVSNKIGKITTSGAITEYAIPTSAAGPEGIAAGPDGNLWFTEAAFASNKIGNMTPNGSFTEFVIQTPTAEPEDITVGPDGSLWFSEYSSSKVGRLLVTEGIAEYMLPTVNAGPSGIATGPDGNVWFTEVQGNKIGKITP